MIDAYDEAYENECQYERQRTEPEYVDDAAEDDARRAAAIKARRWGALYPHLLPTKSDEKPC